MTRDDLASDFAASLEGLTPISDREGRFDHAPVRVRTFVDDLDWPDALAVSARAVVFKGPAVVVIRRHDGYRHIIPGGRREAGETPEQAARREVLEECGWRMGPLTRLGFEHVRHLDQPPAGYPASGFVNPIYLAEGVSFRRADRDLTQSETGSSLVPITRALRELPAWGAALLRAAAAAR